jgi:hypothetical protein
MSDQMMVHRHRWMVSQRSGDGGVVAAAGRREHVGLDGPADELVPQADPVLTIDHEPERASLFETGGKVRIEWPVALPGRARGSGRAVLKPDLERLRDIREGGW